MHSSYGLAFVMLFIGAGVLVVDDVRRRRLSVAALVALVGVPSAVMLTALALAYDPQRMRYVAFSVALAATVLGTALRVRLLAWASVSLTAVTLALSVAYFVPRPAGLALFSSNRTPERTARGSSRRRAATGIPTLSAFSRTGFLPHDDRARRRTQHVPLPCLGRRVATHRAVRPRGWTGPRGCRVARGRPLSADERASPRGGRVGASARVPGRLADLQPLLTRPLVTLASAPCAGRPSAFRQGRRRRRR